ncbi:hypothetical protein RND81_08G054400 [Saponaria officinalis]
MDSARQELEKAKGFEEKLVEKTVLYEQTVTGLKAQTDLLNQELEMAKSMEIEMIERETLKEKIVRDLELELRSLKEELLISESFREKLSKMEYSYEQMNVELEAARMAESYALSSLDEWKARAEELEYKVAETARLERSASESLDSVMKQLEGNSDTLHEAECEVAALKEKVSLLEISLVNRKEDLEESETRLRKASEEAKEAAKVIESVRCELEIVKEEKMQALENEKLTAENVHDLLEEKNNLINELETLKREEEKSKMAMESLASALHEVSAEAREAKERLLSSQVEHENFENQIEHLQLVVKATSEKYESMLDNSRREIDHLTNTVKDSKIEFDSQMEDLKVVLKASNDNYENMLNEAKQEIDHLTNTLRESKMEHENRKAEWEVKELELLDRVKQLEEKEVKLTEMLESSYEESKAEWEQKELQLVNGLKRSEEEKSSIEKEIMRLVNLLREAEEKAGNMRDEESKLELEASSLKEALEEAEAKFVTVKENLHGTEIELRNVMKENEQLRAAEDSNAWKIDELTKLLEEAKVHHQKSGNGELSDSDKEYDVLPKVVGFAEENGQLAEKELVTEKSNGVSRETGQTGVVYFEEVNGKPMTPENNEKVKDETAETDTKMWESYKVDREFSIEMETEQGSLDDEVESKADNAESLDLNGHPSENGANSDSKQQKKKKPLYRKFGNLLKKGISNPK